jgi:hypothetical protein
MQVEEETVTRNTCPSDSLDSNSEVLKGANTRMSHDRFELLERTLRVRQMIGKVSPDVAELVHEMRERGA